MCALVSLPFGELARSPEGRMKNPARAELERMKFLRVVSWWFMVVVPLSEPVRRDMPVRKAAMTGGVSANLHTLVQLDLFGGGAAGGAGEDEGAADGAVEVRGSRARDGAGASALDQLFADASAARDEVELQRRV